MQTPRHELDHWPDPADANSPRSILAADLYVEGKVSSRGPIDLQGCVVGSLQAPEVVVAPTGRLEGSISAREVSVLGAASGTISAQIVQLAPSAVVQADVVHKSIRIEGGAELEGRLQRKT